MDLEEKVVSVGLLDLDPENPRLPPEMSDDSQEEILVYIWRTGQLDELAYSFVENGYFEAERLIVVPDCDRFTVVEGNRRLATLQILLGLHETAASLNIEVPGDRQDELQLIPCLVADHTDSVRTYLAYRHIGGMKTWSSEARARFTSAMVDRAVGDDHDRPFRQVGRVVGSNAQGVRNSYLAYTVLRFAREELGLDTRYLLYERFGVWTRCMNSGNVREYIGIGRPSTYQECQESLRQIDRFRLGEVVDDLTPKSVTSKALVSDSRDITTYGQVLANESARMALRQYEDFGVARRIVREDDLGTRTASLAASVERLLNDVSLASSPIRADLEPPSERLSRFARALLAVVRDLDPS